MHTIEILTLVTGILYLVLEIMQKNVMWVVGILTSILSLVLFSGQGLYAFAGLQVYYLAISVYGLYRWRRDSKLLAETESAQESGGAKIFLNRMSMKVRIAGIWIFFVLTLVLYCLLKAVDDPQPLLDAAISSMGVVATWWLSRSHIEQWEVWIFANALSVLMCALQGMWWMAVLYVFYTASAVYGLYHWHRHGVCLE